MGAELSFVVFVRCGWKQRKGNRDVSGSFSLSPNSPSLLMFSSPFFLLSLRMVDLLSSSNPNSHQVIILSLPLFSSSGTINQTH